MTRWGSPERGAPADTGVARERPVGRAALLGRSAVAPILLAFTTVAGLAGAVLALLPAAIRGRPTGRLGPRRAEDAEGETASEPIAR